MRSRRVAGLPRVYASLPLTGPAASPGREVLRGAELALEMARTPEVELAALDGFAEDREAQARTNALRAAADDGARAYLGDFHSSQVAETAPLLGAAGLLQVSPVSTQVGLESPTLVRIMPDDRAGARAVAAWLVEARVAELLLVHDHDRDYGAPVGAMCAEAARERGVNVRARPVWDRDERATDDLDAAEAVLYVGVAGSGAVALWHELHAADPELLLLGSEGIAMPWFAERLEASAAERTRFFVAAPTALGFYGFEAMALALDAIAAGDDRQSVVRAARATRDRDSVIGRYSLDERGQTTTSAYGRQAVVDGRLVWDQDRTRSPFGS